MKAIIDAEVTTDRYSPRASLAAIGLKLQSIDLFGPIRELVKIPQKIIKHSPIDKLQDAFITILAGAKGIVELNTRLRADKALQRAFGRKSCAEQSTVQDTLNASNADTIAGMRQALDKIYQQHSLAYQHPYRKSLQLLDIDFTGLPAGPQAELSKKGYFDKKIRYGRQLGRVTAALYEEIVVDCLYAGNVQLQQGLRELVTKSEHTLELDEQRRRRTIIRMDAGGGKYDDINWLLERGYQLHCREYSSQRVPKAAEVVSEWIDDTKIPGRQFGWLPEKITIPNVLNYLRPVRRLISRRPKPEGGFAFATMLVSTLEPGEVVTLMHLPADTIKDSAAVTRAYAHFYDERSGGIEVEIKEDKQGIGINKRSKKKFEAQQMIMLLGTLAHNVLVWSRRWLAKDAPRFAQYGILRLVRDVLTISGIVKMDRREIVMGIALNDENRLTDDLTWALRRILPGCIEVDIGFY